MTGVKGKSGRKPKYPNDPTIQRLRETWRKQYYKHRQKTLDYRREWHQKRVAELKLSDRLRVSHAEARKILKDNPDLKKLLEQKLHRKQLKKRVEKRLEEVRKSLGAAT